MQQQQSPSPAISPDRLVESPLTGNGSSPKKLRQRNHRKVNYISLGFATFNQAMSPAVSFWTRQHFLVKAAVYGWLLCTWWIFALLALFWVPPIANTIAIVYVLVFDAPTFVEHLEQALQDNYGISFPVTFRLLKRVADIFNNTIGLGLQLVIYFAGYLNKRVTALVQRLLRFWIGMVLAVADRVLSIASWLFGVRKGNISNVSSRTVSRNPSPTPRKLIY